MIRKLLAQYLLRMYKTDLINDIESNFRGDGSDIDDWFVELRNEAESCETFHGVANVELSYDGDDELTSFLPLVLVELDKWLKDKETDDVIS